MAKTKAGLRAGLKQRRLALAKEDRRRFSQAINERLLKSLSWADVKRLHFFEPLEPLGEVNILGFIDKLQQKHPDIKLFTSRQLKNTWQISSLDGQPVAPLKLDVIIVPMLGFDESLHRLGYGSGYYDKFLSAQRQAIKIGVCFEIGKVSQLPHEAHDVALYQIITEERTHKGIL